jgi:hypothetical protein
LIKIEVGRASLLPTRRSFYVRKSILVKHSELFTSVFSKNWKEKKEKKEKCVHLADEDDEPEVFEIFYHFLHTGQIFSDKNSDYAAYDDGSSTDAEWKRLVDCWIMGNKSLSTSFKDATADAFVAKVEAESRVPTSLHGLVSALSKDWKENREKCVKLSDEDPKIF